MKKGLFLIFIFAVTMMTVFLGCKKKEARFAIELENEIVIHESEDVKVTYEGRVLGNNEFLLTVSNTHVAQIFGSKIKAVGYGKTVLSAVYKNNQKIYASVVVEVIPPFVKDIVITGPNEAYEDESVVLKAKVLPESANKPLTWSSSDESVLSVEDGIVDLYKAGTALIYVKCGDFVKEFPMTVLPHPTEIIISGKNKINVGEVAVYAFNIGGEINLTSSDDEVASVLNNIVIGKKKGAVTLFAVEAARPGVVGEFSLEVGDAGSEISETDAEKAAIDLLIREMNLRERVGQMFCLGFDSAYIFNRGEMVFTAERDANGLPHPQLGDVSYDFDEYLKNYPIANFSVTSFLADDKQDLEMAVSTLKRMAYKINRVNPLILLSYPYYGFQDPVLPKSLRDPILHIPTNYALGLNPDPEKILALGEAYARGLKYFGINASVNNYLDSYPAFASSDVTFTVPNATFIPYVDPARRFNSFSDNLETAQMLANLIRVGYENENVVFVPGMSYDKMYIKDDPSDLGFKDYSLPLLKNAVKNGVDLLNIPSQVAAYQTMYYGGEMRLASNAAFMQYLRGDLNYNGVCLFDSVGFNSFLNTEEDDFYRFLIDSVNNGMDMIGCTLYFGNFSPYKMQPAQIAERVLGAFDKIVEAAESGEIAAERIEEAVRRILLMKMRHHILDGSPEEDIDYRKVRSDIKNLAPDFVSISSSDCRIDYNGPTVFFSEGHSWQSSTLNTPSEAFSAFFKRRGYTNVTTFNLNTFSERAIYDYARSAQRVYICVSNYNPAMMVGIGKTMNLETFVSNLKDANPRLCLILLEDMADASVLDNFQSYVYTYGYYDSEYENLFRVLGGDARGNTRTPQG